MKPFPKPTRQQLLDAAGTTIDDLIAPNLKVLFCGINPGLYSGATGHHFARPGNRFWPALYAAGFSRRLLSPFEKEELLKDGYGITNLVRRTTNAASELTRQEYVKGARALERKVRKYRPKVVAFLGIGAYRDGFGRPKAKLGRQDETLGGAVVWVLPNPSGLNAHFPPKALAELFKELKREAERL